jgi:hypothetical protein
MDKPHGIMEKWNDSNIRIGAKHLISGSPTSVGKTSREALISKESRKIVEKLSGNSDFPTGR